MGCQPNGYGLTLFLESNREGLGTFKEDLNDTTKFKIEEHDFQHFYRMNVAEFVNTAR